MNGEGLMKDDSFHSENLIKIREDCIEILNAHTKRLTEEIQQIQEKNNESQKQKSELIFAKHKIDIQYDSNNTLFSPYEKSMHQKEEEKLDLLLSYIEESKANYAQEIFERQNHLKEISLLKECIESNEAYSLNLLKMQELERKRITEDLKNSIICELNALVEKSKAYSNICKKYPNKGKQGLDEINRCLKKITTDMESIQ